MTPRPSHRGRLIGHALFAEPSSYRSSGRLPRATTARRPVVEVMKSTEHWSVQVVLAAIIVGVGVFLILGPLRLYLHRPPESAYAVGTSALSMVAFAYLAGFLVTRTVDHAFKRSFRILAVFRIDLDEAKKKRQKAHDAIASAVFFAGCIWFLGYAVFIAAAVTQLSRWFAYVVTFSQGRP